MLLTHLHPIVDSRYILNVVWCIVLAIEFHSHIWFKCKSTHHLFKNYWSKAKMNLMQQTWNVWNTSNWCLWESIIKISKFKLDLISIKIERRCVIVGKITFHTRICINIHNPKWANRRKKEKTFCHLMTNHLFLFFCLFVLCLYFRN